jgi:hypothetical protein
MQQHNQITAPPPTTNQLPPPPVHTTQQLPPAPVTQSNYQQQWIQLTSQMEGRKITHQPQLQNELRRAPLAEYQSTNKTSKTKHQELEAKIQQLQDVVKDLEEENVKHAKKSALEKIVPREGNKKKTGATATTTNASSTHDTGKKKKTTTNPTHQTTSKKGDNTAIPDYSDDESSVNDGVDYSKTENYAVKKIIGHNEIKMTKQGRQIKLYTRWKGWRESNSIMLEPLHHMVKDWPNEVKAYCLKTKKSWNFAMRNIQSY